MKIFNILFTLFLILLHVSVYKIKAKGTSMQLLGADWMQSNRREDDLGSRPGGIVQV